jgi:uncharacterized membrane protein YGL010W
VTLPCLSYLGILNPINSHSLFIQYSAVILAFLGGVHWHDALSRTTSKSQMSIAMLPSLVAWFSLFYPNGKISLTLLAAGFLLMLIYDLLTLQTDKQYRLLRLKLTIITVLSHALMGTIN